ncbi:UNKNOWN [Stylonychia lemnae]|uniref:Uncharacterized protein n=1 Tax=Stylonychia lemnae TaxID=5949 RepID=A0A078A7G0_STYLE|nr:UNKNOWN [Stylonychia lemnae]|eukprot:CDW77482.1 UNKNOWN [Stylonychia lemnae]
MSKSTNNNIIIQLNKSAQQIQNNNTTKASNVGNTSKFNLRADSEQQNSSVYDDTHFNSSFFTIRNGNKPNEKVKKIAQKDQQITPTILEKNNFDRDAYSTIQNPKQNKSVRNEYGSLSQLMAKSQQRYLQSRQKKLDQSTLGNRDESLEASKNSLNNFLKNRKQLLKNELNYQSLNQKGLKPNMSIQNRTFTAQPIVQSNNSKFNQNTYQYSTDTQSFSQHLSENMNLTSFKQKFFNKIKNKTKSNTNLNEDVNLINRTQNSSNQNVQRFEIPQIKIIRNSESESSDSPINIKIGQGEQFLNQNKRSIRTKQKLEDSKPIKQTDRNKTIHQQRKDSIESHKSSQQSNQFLGHPNKMKNFYNLAQKVKDDIVIERTNTNESSLISHDEKVFSPKKYQEYKERAEKIVKDEEQQDQDLIDQETWEVLFQIQKSKQGPLQIRNSIRFFLTNTEIHKRLLNNQKNFEEVQTEVQEYLNNVSPKRPSKNIDLKEIQKMRDQIQSQQIEKFKEQKIEELKLKYQSSQTYKPSQMITIKEDRKTLKDLKIIKEEQQQQHSLSQSQESRKQDQTLQVDKKDKQKELKMKLKRQAMQKNGMNFIKLNEMISTLRDRLGFVSKKQKIKELFKQIAEDIYENKKEKSRISKSSRIINRSQMAGEDSIFFNDQNSSQSIIKNDRNFQTVNNFSKNILSKEKYSLSQDPKYNTITEPKFNIRLEKAQQSTSSYGHQSCKLKYNESLKAYSQANIKLEQSNSIKEYSSQLLSQILRKTPDQNDDFNNNESPLGIFDQPRPSDPLKPGNISVVRDIMGSLYSDEKWSKIASNPQFSKVMELMCDFYGMKSKVNNKYDNDPRFLLAQKQFKKYFKEENQLKAVNTLIKLQTDKLINEEDDEEKKSVKKEQQFNKLLQAAGKSDEIIDNNLKNQSQIMNRYSKFLNKCFFIAQDDFIKKKYKQYITKTGQAGGQNFYKRMEKDTQLRKEKQQQTIFDMKSTYFNQKSTIDKASNRDSSTDIDQKTSFRRPIIPKINNKMPSNPSLVPFECNHPKVEQDDLLMPSIEETDLLLMSRSKSSSTYAGSTKYGTGAPKNEIARNKLFGELAFERIEEERGTYESFKKIRPSRIQGISGDQIIDLKIQDLEFKIMTKKRKDKMKSFSENRIY